MFEMGGYLPLELSEGSLPWSHLDPSDRFEVNTGRTAIWCALKSLHVRKLFLPAYYCPNVVEMLRKTGVELCFYGIDRDFLPVDVHDEPDSALLLVNYYGLLTEKLEPFLRRFDKVILDKAHALFAPPVLREGVMNVYSFRKFVGVSDGGCLIGKGIERPELELDQSHPRAMHLFKCYETGTNGAYAESKASENSLEAFRLLSPLTRRILQGVDYGRIENKRRENAKCLHERLADVQRLRFSLDGSAPYLYPLLLDRDIHRALVERHIYVPYLWSQLLDEAWNGTTEQEFARNIVALPVDQRYGEAEMCRLAEIIEEILQA